MDWLCLPGQVRIKEVRRVFLRTDVLEYAAVVSQNKRVEGEFHLCSGLAIIYDEVEKLTEENPNFLLFFMPTSNVL